MKLLLAEDEKDMADVLTTVLKHQGYDTDWAENGKVLLEKMREDNYDCIISDVMMPVMDGVTAVKTLRSQGDVTPVLLLTAKTEVDDRITGLDAGADDYLTKPFAIGELLARIRSLTRRGRDMTPSVLSAGNTTLDTEEQELSAQNGIRLSGKENRLLKIFLLHPGKALPTDFLFEKVWYGEDDVDESVVWIYISYLRGKLSSIGSDLEILGEEGGSFTLTQKLS